MNTRIAIGIILAAILAFPVSPAEKPNEITLREYVDVRFDAQEKAVTAALAAADRAVAKAEAASDKRFESVNEFRKALEDNNRLQMPRSETEGQFKTINEKVEELTKRVNAKEEQGRGLNRGWEFLIAVIALAAALAALYAALKPRIAK